MPRSDIVMQRSIEPPNIALSSQRSSVHTNCFIDLPIVTSRTSTVFQMSVLASATIRTVPTHAKTSAQLMSVSPLPAPPFFLYLRICTLGPIASVCFTNTKPPNAVVSIVLRRAVVVSRALPPLLSLVSTNTTIASGALNQRVSGPKVEVNSHHRFMVSIFQSVRGCVEQVLVYIFYPQFDVLR